MRKLISPRQAAKLLGKHHSHVYRLMERGEVEEVIELVERRLVLFDTRKCQLVRAKKPRKT